MKRKMHVLGMIIDSASTNNKGSYDILEIFAKSKQELANPVVLRDEKQTIRSIK